MRVREYYIVLISFLFVTQTLHAAKDKPDVCATSIARFDRQVVHHDPYRWLEQSSDERTKWLEAQSEQIQKYLLEITPLVDYWKSTLFEVYDEPASIKTMDLRNGFSLELIDQGLNQPNEILLYENGKQIRRLFSSHDVSKDGSIGVTKFFVDPKRKYLLVPVVKAGSLDVADIYVINIETGVVQKVLREVYDYGITWISPTKFIYGRYIDSDGVSYVHDITSSGQDDLRYDASQKGNSFNSPDGSILATVKSGRTTLRLLDQDRVEELDFEVSEFIAVTSSAIFLKRKGRDGWNEIVKVSLGKTPAGGIRLGQYQVINVGKGNLDRFFIDKDQVMMSFSLGEKRWATLIDELGDVERRIQLPSSARMVGFKKLPKKKAKLKFDSQVVKGVEFTYDLEASRFDTDLNEIDRKLLTDKEGNEFVHQYVTVTSKDKKTFPVRVTYKKGLILNGDNPALVEGYGGFDVSGYLDPAYRPEIKQFLDDGGIYVAPALRGGNELGPAWHDDATFESGDKQNTFNDMIATLKMLEAQKFSNPNRIAIEGWSNGGYLIGAMITQAPELFKLGIPGNGVQDQLRKQILDPRFDGWAYEYGNPEEDIDAFKKLAKLSPVNQARKKRNYPSVLVIVGEDDSRVNAAHSYKLVAALQRSQTGTNPILMLAVEKSGHWVSKQTLQDLRAYRTQWMKWSIIYHQLGIKPQ